MPDLRRTPLYDIHAERGARFVPFAGWEMPVQYTGVVAEHKTVRDKVGMFDVSHMGELVVEGPQAIEGVNFAVTNNVGKLVDGKALYTVMCKADGGIVDDLIVYRESDNRLFLVVNGARRAADFAHLGSLLEPFDCTLRDESDDWALIAVQGPEAIGVVSKVTDAAVADLAPFAFLDATVGGVDNVRVARTGYTGEDGVELYCPAGSAAAVWTAVEAAGADVGIGPCGLGARDTLRLEMKFALYGHDIDEDHNPYEAGLGWTVKLKKGDFCGRDALVAVKQAGPARKLVGFKMKERGIPREGYVIQVDGRDVGVVTSGTHSPTLGEPIGVGYVAAEHAAVATPVHIVIRNKPVAAVVVPTPFYKREA